MSGPSGGTAVAGVIGWPITRSLSPAIHNAGYAALGLDWVYAAFPVPPDRVGEAIHGMRALGIRGLNVTMPHKQAVIDALDEVEEPAATVAAVNTITLREGRLVGSNTDGEGFLRFLRADAGIDPAGRPAVVLGAGGAARAVAGALVAAGAETTVAARRADAAEAAAAAAGARAGEWSAAAVAAALGPEALVVNATPAEVSELPLEAGRLPAGVAVVDLRYGPPVPSLVAAAREAGLRSFDGLGMLVHQAALAFERWTGAPAPLEAMARAAGDAARRAPASR